MTRYTLTYGTLIKVLPESPEGWNEHQATLARSEKYHGLLREFNASMRFVGQGADICRLAYFTSGIEAKVYLKIESWNSDAMQYDTIMAAGELDFSGATIGRDYFECPVVDGGLSASLKANDEVTYQLEARITEVLRYSGVRLYTGSANWTKGYFATGQIWYDHSAQPLGVNVPIAINGTPTDASQGGYLPYTIPEAPPYSGYFFKAVRICKVDISISADSVAMTTYLKQSHYNGGGASDRWWFRMYLTIAAPSGTTSTKIAEFNIIPSQLIGGYYTNQIGGSLSYSASLTLEAGSYAFITWAWDATDPAQEQNDNFADFEEVNMVVTTAVQSVLPTVNINGYTGKSLFAELADRMYNGAVVKSDFLDNLPTNEQPWFTSGDAIRNESPFYMKLSFTQFFNCLAAIYDIGVGVENIAGVDTLVLEERTYFYENYVGLNIGEVSNVEISTAGEMLYKTLNVGYPVQEYKEKNGRDEFNAGQQWVLPFTHLNTEIDRRSPIRADMYGIDSVRINYYADTDNTDTKSDNDVFIVDTEFVETIAGVDYYQCSRDKVTYIYGLENEDTAYNINYSPKRCLLRHKEEIAGVCWGMVGNIIQSSADKNNQLSATIGGILVSESANIAISSLGTPDFYPFYFQFDAPIGPELWQLLPTYAKKAIKFTYNGVNYYGFIMEVGVNVDHSAVYSFRLLCSSLTTPINLI